MNIYVVFNPKSNKCIQAFEDRIEAFDYADKDFEVTCINLNRKKKGGKEMTKRSIEKIIEKVIWLIEDSYPDTDEWGHDTLVDNIKESLETRADELNRMFGDSEIPTFIDKACEIVRDLANEYFGDWEQSCKFEDKFRKAMEERED